jgi:hypothetical protein
VVGYGTYSIDYDADGNEICLWTSCEENCLFQTVQADPRDCGIDTSDGADTGDIVVCYDENKLPVEVGVVEYMWSGELCVAYTCGEDGQWIKELAEKVEYCPAVVSEDVVSEVTFHVYVCDRWEALVDSDVYKKLILAEYGDYIKTELGLDSYQLVSIYDLLKLSATDEENEYALYQLTIFFGDADTANSIVDLINTLSKKFDQDCLKVTIVDGEVIRAEADVQVYQCAATGSYSKSQEKCASAWEQFVEDGGEVDVVDLTDLMGSSSLLREFQGSATSVSVSSVALLFVALVAAIIQVN